MDDGRRAELAARFAVFHELRATRADLLGQAVCYLGGSLCERYDEKIRLELGRVARLDGHSHRRAGCYRGGAGR